MSEPVASVMSSVVPRGFEKPTAPVLAATLTVALGVRRYWWDPGPARWSRGHRRMAFPPPGRPLEVEAERGAEARNGDGSTVKAEAVDLENERVVQLSLPVKQEVGHRDAVGGEGTRQSRVGSRWVPSEGDGRRCHCGDARDCRQDGADSGVEDWKVPRRFSPLG